MRRVAFFAFVRFGWLLLFALGGCQPHPVPAADALPERPLGFVELQLTFSAGVDAAVAGSFDRRATRATLQPLARPAAADAATVIPYRVDFEVTSATLVTRGGLDYIALEVEVTNRSGRELRNLTMLAYRSRDAAMAESALTQYAGSAAHTAAAAARVTPFTGGFLPESGDPLRLTSAVRLGTVFYAPDDPAFAGLRTLLATAPYQDFVADLFPYGFVVGGEGARILADNATATLQLGFRVLPNTSEFRWRAVLVEDPRLRLGLPADFNERAQDAGDLDNLVAYLDRLSALITANPGEPVAGVVLGSVAGFPGERVVLIRDDAPIAATAPYASAFAAGLLSVETVADVLLSSGPGGANGWLNQAAVSEVYLLERYASVGGHTFVAPVPPGRSELAVEVLVVGGGGGAGHSSVTGGGGGGGAGGVLLGSSGLASGSYPLVVGAGGAGSLASSPAGTQGADGAPSTFLAWTALGGGGGGGSGSGGRPGASGGGAGRDVGGPGATMSGGGALQGSPGGQVSTPLQGLGAGGGGAAAAGGDSAAGLAGAGGAGVLVSITGQGVAYAGGGGGGAGVGRGVAGGEGAGGGGAGALAGDGQAATPGSGGGGGGGGGDGTLAKKGGDGGSGVVFIRYPIAPER
jgi:hypothetical protein